LDGGIIRKDGGAAILNEYGSELGIFSSNRRILHFDNPTEGGTTIVDDGFGPPVIWELMNGAVTTLVDPKFGTSSLLLNGTNQYLRVSDPPGNLSTAEFTFHTWFKCTAVGGTPRTLLAQTSNATINPINSTLLFERTAANLIQFTGYNLGLSLVVTGTSQFTDVLKPGWNHAAIVRDNQANLLRLFLNGVQEGSLAIAPSAVINDTGGYFNIGAAGDSTPFNFWQGNIDEAVYVVGRALWTSNFTPPEKPTARAGIGADIPAPIVAGINWSPNVGVTQDVVYLLTGGGAIVLADIDGDASFGKELTATIPGTRDPPPYFCVAGGEDIGKPRKLFLFSATNQVSYYPGNSPVGTKYPMVPIETPPPDWTGVGNFPTFGVVHLGRLWGGGNASDPHRMYYSELLDHGKFVGTGAGAAGTIPIYPGEGEKLVAAYSIRGALIVWKYPVGVYVISTPDGDPTTWLVQKMSLAVGTVNAHTVVQIENDVLYMDRNGAIHSMQATSDFGDFNTSNISDFAKMQPFMKDEINRTMIHRAHALYYTNKRQAWFFVPRRNSDVPNLRIQLGMESAAIAQQNQGLGPRFFMSRRDQASSSWMRPAPEDGGIPKPAIGEEDGCIYLLDQDARNKRGAGYPIEFSTANTDLAFASQGGELATKQKNGEFLEIVYEPEGEWDLLVDVFWDDHWVDMLAFNMGGAGVPLDVFMLDRDVLGASGVKEVRRRLVGSGRRFRMTCRNDGLNENVSIAQFHLSFGVGDERTPEGRR
jgi:hypothetical protein